MQKDRLLKVAKSNTVYWPSNLGPSFMYICVLKASMNFEIVGVHRHVLGILAEGVLFPFKSWSGRCMLHVACMQEDLGMQEHVSSLNTHWLNPNQAT